MSKVACANLKEKHPSAIELPHCLVCNGSQTNTGCDFCMNLRYEQHELEGKLFEEWKFWFHFLSYSLETCIVNYM